MRILVWLLPWNAKNGWKSQEENDIMRFQISREISISRRKSLVAPEVAFTQKPLQIKHQARPL